jgi:hypothetical protein
VAHFGRGRGHWAHGQSPPHWQDVVAAALAPWREALDAAWAERRLGSDDPVAAAALAARLEPIVSAAAWACLHALYPEADMAREAPENTRAQAKDAT